MVKLSVRTELYRRHRIHGFTLLEVMIALVIVAILAAIAYPSYRDSVTRTRRAEGKAALMDLANRMERFFIDRNSYATATIAAGANTDVLGAALTENGYYSLAIDGGGATTATTYRIRAVPQGTQATNDATCGSLILDNAGVKTVSATTDAGIARDCWRR